VTSRARQREQAAVLAAGHGKIVAEFFDSGESRTRLAEELGAVFAVVEVF
jgi:hypothetical protein